MNDNKFQIMAIARWLEESKEMFARIGMREHQYAPELGAIADLATEKIISKSSQFLFEFDEVGSLALAERHNVTDRTIRNWRKDLLNLKIGKIKAA